MAAVRFASALVLLSSTVDATFSNCSASAPSFYTSNHAALLLNGSLFSWSSFQGQVGILTNVASF